MVDIMSSPQTLRLGADVGYPCGLKRRRHDNYCTPAKFDEEIMRHNKISENSPEYIFESSRKKRYCGQNEREFHSGENDRMDLLQRNENLEREVAILRQECSEKTKELELARSSLRKLMDTLAPLEQQYSKIEEENKIFKRALSTLDTKYKELGQQNNQLQNILGQAAVYVANLESETTQLKERIRMMNAPDFISPYLPPDVY